jgi:hypothetical protein
MKSLFMRLLYLCFGIVTASAYHQERRAPELGNYYKFTGELMLDSFGTGCAIGTGFNVDRIKFCLDGYKSYKEYLDAMVKSYFEGIK